MRINRFFYGCQINQAINLIKYIPLCVCWLLSENLKVYAVYGLSLLIISDILLLHLMVHVLLHAKISFHI